MLAFGTGTLNAFFVLTVDKQVMSKYIDSQTAETTLVCRLIHSTGM